MHAMLGLRRPVIVVAIVNLLIVALPNTSAAQALAPGDVVLWTASASPANVHGDWVRQTDATAAGGVVLRNPDRGRSKVTPALASPANYFELRFTAKRVTAYYLWIRMRAQSNSTANDSIYVQFNDSVDIRGQPRHRIGTTSAAGVVLQNGTNGSAPRGWGWADNGWDSRALPFYFASDGAHTVRIQQRDDGAEIDQVVLSPVTFASSAPGSLQSDTRILRRAWSLGPSVSAATSVIRVAAAAAGRTYGTWQTISDATAAGSQALRNGDTGAAKIAPALSNPASYFEATFNADAGRRYHVWLRMRADGNSTANDSVYLQFSGSVTSGGSPTARIGTTSSLEGILQAGISGAAPSGWGWTDNGYGSFGSHIYFATTGTQTIRVQQREDGAAIDQIVISPDTYLTIPPGWTRNDQTIYGASQSPSINLPPSVTLAAPGNGASYTAPASMTLSATAYDPEGRLAKVDFYNGATLLASDTTAPYSFSWISVPAGTYQLKAVARDAAGGSASSLTATVTVRSATATSSARRVAFTASVDHAIVSRYLLEVFPSTANTATAVALTSSDLGKPTPSSTKEIIVDRTTFLNGLAPGSYRITVASIGSGGKRRSAAISFTR